jgi:hypothetical protein
MGSVQQAESETTAVAAGEPAPGESLTEPDQDTESSNEQSASGDGTGSPCAKMPVTPERRSAVSASYLSLLQLRNHYSLSKCRVCTRLHGLEDSPDPHPMPAGKVYQFWAEPCWTSALCSHFASLWLLRLRLLFVLRSTCILCPLLVC